jgi:tripartite ATP-independent transporter DctM subunit
LAFLYSAYILIACYLNPKLGPPLSLEERKQVSIRQRFKMALISIFPPSLLILGVLGSIFSGIATPTEASGIGAILALVMTIAYGRFSWRMLKETTISTAKTVSMVMIILVGATCFTGVFMGIGGGKVLSSLIFGLGFGKWGTFVAMMLVIVILGAFIDWIGIVYLTFPIFLPVAVEIGLDPLWFVVMVAVCLQTSFLSPPFGYALFYMKGIAGEAISTADIYLSILPFMIIIAVGIFVLILFPQLITIPAGLIR